MQGWYHVYGQKPTAATHSVRVNLYNAYEPVLAVARINHIDIYEITLNGLIPLPAVDIFGRIASINTMPMPGSEGLDILVVCTEDNSMLFLYADRDKLKALSAIDIADDLRSPLDTGIKVAIDTFSCARGVMLGHREAPAVSNLKRAKGSERSSASALYNTLVVAHNYQSTLKVIPIVEGKIGDCRTVRVVADEVLGMTFVNNTSDFLLSGHGSSGTSHSAISQAISTSSSSSSSVAASRTASSANTATTTTTTTHRRHKVLPILCVLSLDQDKPQLNFYQMGIEQDTSVDITNEWQNTDLPPTASFVTAVPGTPGGVLVGCESGLLVYIDRTTNLVVPCEPGSILCADCYDTEKLRFVLGDSEGSLRAASIDFSVTNNQATVTGIVTERIGSVNTPSSVTYLESELVFVCCGYGNSMVVRLTTDEETSKPALVVVDEHETLAPIMDMVTVDQGEYGKKQIVTASGVHEAGALRVVRQGVTISASAAIELDGVQALYTLATHELYTLQQQLAEAQPEQGSDQAMDQSSDGDACGTRHDVIVVSFGDSAILLKVDGEELENVDAELPGEGKIHLMTNTADGNWCLVRGHDAFIISSTSTSLQSPGADGLRVLAAWHSEVPIGGVAINHALLAVSANRTVYAFDPSGPFDGDSPARFIPFAQTEMEKEIATVGVVVESSMRYVAVSLWETLTAHILIAPLPRAVQTTMKQLCSTELVSDVIATSCALSVFSGDLYALFGLGDGFVNLFKLEGSAASSKGEDKDNDDDDDDNCNGNGIGDLDTSEDGGMKSLSFGHCRNIQIGKKPVTISAANMASSAASLANAGTGGEPSSSKHIGVFAMSNETLLFYAANNAVSYSSVNGDALQAIAPLNTEAFANSFVYASPSSLSIGSVRNVQKLHIRTVPLGGTPSVLCTSPDGRYVIVGIQFEEEPYRSVIRVFDAESLDFISEATFDANEWVNTIHMQHFDAVDKQCVVVGTVIVREDEDQPSEGFLKIFTLNEEQHLQLAYAAKVNGSVYKACELQGYLAATINSRVVVFELLHKNSKLELAQVCGQHGFGILVSVQASDDLLLVGDWFKSAFVLKFQDRKLITLVEAPSSSWLSATAFIDSVHSFVADTNGNLFVNKMVSSETKDKFVDVGSWYAGEHINAFRRGYLCCPSTDEDIEFEKSLAFTYGTVSGAIGCLIPLSATNFGILAKVQDAMRRVVRSVGGLRHDLHRHPKTEKMQIFLDASGFIDGDLVERFLTMPPHEQQEVCADLTYKDVSADVDKPLTVSVAEALVSTMSRWH